MVSNTWQRDSGARLRGELRDYQPIEDGTGGGAKEARTSSSGEKFLRNSKKFEFFGKITSELPTYQKFLVLSTKGSFTNAHIDLSVTATFFHVKNGKKVFYIVPPTPENLEIYERVEKKEMS
ncbi:hypothetical protein B9Z55_028332 [Caenorhabditis nigoni]|uniref:JmjC domain-containing protein n=1 Tax=Caenorhabditis nigoni TaxID=1611254 RepID=A0A2G5SBT6_9PELO|nr:hypothetical protein B9Z55_028332 [Caenorhabditis nigoni]